MLAAIPLLGGCAGPLSALDPAGPSAQAIAGLWWAMLWGAVAISLFMFALLAVAIARPSMLAALSSRAFIVYGGLAFPSAVLAVLLVYALVMGERLIPRETDATPLRIEVQARQWMWEFSYPETPGAASTRDVLHLPAGRPVDLVVTSADVIHSFWIPRLGGKIDAVPGHVNVIRLTADRPGAYRGICAEFCGVGHTAMDFRVQAHDEDGYAAAISGASEDAR